MSTLGERLGSGRALLLDGGLGSALLARGLEAGAAPEQWNLERPDEVLAVHRAYAQAGSAAVHANSFGANPVRLAKFSLADHTEALNHAAVELARRSGAALVIGDVGPTGEYLPPVGQAEPQALRQAFLRQGAALAEAGVDALHVETMSDLREAWLALEALREAAPDVPVMVSLTFERKRRGFFTVMGDALAASLVELGRAGAVAVGANCSITSGDMLPLAEQAVAALAEAGLAVPLVVQPNAGQPQMSPEGLRYEQSPEAFAAEVGAMAAAGAGAVGGCCGTDARFIGKLAQALEGIGTGAAAREGQQ